MLCTSETLSFGPNRGDIIICHFEKNKILPNDINKGVVVSTWSYFNNELKEACKNCKYDWSSSNLFDEYNIISYKTNEIYSKLVEISIEKAKKQKIKYLTFTQLYTDTIWGIPSAIVMPPVMKTIDLYSACDFNKIFIILTAKESYINAINEIKKRIHDRNLPKALHCSEFMKLEKELVSSPIRNDYNVKGRCFSIENFFSKHECSLLINICNKIGFDSISWEYSPSYRKCTRLIGKDQNLADIIWYRVKQLLVRDDIDNIRPYGFGNDGIWNPDHINPCIRFTKYSHGDHFNTHRDGGFVIHDDLRSVYTLMIYLNSGYKGGNTIIHSSDSNVTIEPKTGMALVFNHDLLHEGSKLESNSSEAYKYILRTDIMFKRIDKQPLSAYRNYLNLEEYKKADELYHNSIKFQQEGKPKESTKAYLEALELQAVLASFTKLSCNEDSMKGLPKLPLEIWLKIFSYLSIKDLCTLASTSQYFKYVSEDGYLWKKHYCNTFNFSNLLLENNDEVLINWKILYRDKIKTEKYFDIVFTEFRKEKTYFSSLCTPLALKPYNSRDAEWNDNFKNRGINDDDYMEIPTRIAQIYGHYWSAGSGCRDYYVGNETEQDSWYTINNITTLDQIENEVIYNSTVISTIAKWIFACSFSTYLNSKTHPVLIGLPFSARNQISIISKEYFDLNIPYLSIQSSALLGLYSTTIKSGIVIIFETKTLISIVPIVNYSIIKGHSCSILLQDINNLSNNSTTISDILKKVIDNTKDKFSDNITIVTENIELLSKLLTNSNLLNRYTIYPNEISVAIGAKIFSKQINVSKYFYTKEQVSELNPWISIY